MQIVNTLPSDETTKSRGRSIYALDVITRGNIYFEHMAFVAHHDIRPGLLQAVSINIEILLRQGLSLAEADVAVLRVAQNHDSATTLPLLSKKKKKNEKERKAH